MNREIEMFETLLLVLLLIGVSLLGKGIVGMIITSDSCCFPPNCDAEHTCDAVNPRLESPTNIYGNIQLYLGLFLMSILALVYIILHMHHHRSL